MVDIGGIRINSHSLFKTIKFIPYQQAQFTKRNTYEIIKIQTQLHSETWKFIQKKFIHFYTGYYFRSGCLTDAIISAENNYLL